jgi:hypothetical protein
MKMKCFLISILAILSGCANSDLSPKTMELANNSVVNLPVQPESLIDFANERVSFSMEKSSSLDDLKDWIKNDLPTSAELACDKVNDACKKSADELAKLSVPVKYMSGNNNNVVLIYNKTSAHDCSSLQVKKHHPNFILGCSNSVNILGMVSGYKQLTNPGLLGLRDAGYATQNYNNFYNISLQNME